MLSFIFNYNLNKFYAPMPLEQKTAQSSLNRVTN